MEQHIINGLRTLYPDHQFIGEESMAEVNIMEDLEEHNNDYEKVEADDESEYGDCHPKIKITMALMLIMAIKGRADHLVHLGPDMDHRPDRRDDELCSLESTRVHLRRSHCEQEARCRSHHHHCR